VAREEHVGAVREEEAAVEADAGLVEAGELAQESVRGDHHAVAQHAEHVRVEDARRDQVK
jgi:hypothetical protein